MTAQAAPRIRTTPPGPRARAAIRVDQQYLSPSYTRIYPLVVKRAWDMVVEDVDGNRYLDFNAGIAVCATGHCHPQVVAAIRDQTRRFLHYSGTDFYYKPQIELAKELARAAPGRSPKKVFFTNSGAEAVEAAFKLARYHSGRTRMISFFGGFHGRTMGALSLSGSKIVQVRRFAPLIPDITHVEYGYCYRCPFHLTYPSCKVDCVSYIEREVFHKVVPPEEVAAIIVEPIQGEGGMIVPPPDYHIRLKQLCERYGILFIADEVQTGMGRTGKLFAIEHWGVQPDIICMAKGIASGLPLGAIIARAELMNWEAGSHASTFGGNPVSCRAALATLKLVRNGLMRNAEQLGTWLLNELSLRAGRYPWIGQVRGKGLMIGLEFVKDRAHDPVPDAARRDRVVQKAFKKGLLLLGCGESTLRLSPPLVAKRAHAQIALNILDTIFQEEKSCATH